MKCVDGVSQQIHREMVSCAKQKKKEKKKWFMQELKNTPLSKITSQNSEFEAKKEKPQNE